MSDLPPELLWFSALIGVARNAAWILSTARKAYTYTSRLFKKIDFPISALKKLLALGPSPENVALNTGYVTLPGQIFSLSLLKKPSGY